jgi:AAA ATPase domain
VRLLRLVAKNVLSFGSPGIDLEFTAAPCIVVGPNSVGKTNLFRALSLIGDVFSWRSQDISDYRYMGDEEKPFQLRVTVKLTTSEVDALVDYAIARVVIRWQTGMTTPPKAIDRDVGIALGRRIFEKRRELFTGPLSGPITFEIQGTGNPSSPMRSFIQVGSGKNAFYINRQGNVSLSNAESLGWMPVDVLTLLLSDLEAMYPGVGQSGPNQKPMTEKQFNKFLKTLRADWLVSRLGPAGPIPRAIDFSPINLADYEGRFIADSPKTDRLRNFLGERGLSERNLGLYGFLGSIYDRSLVRLSGQRSKPIVRRVPDIDTIPRFLGNYDGSELPESLFRLKNSYDPRERFQYSVLQRVFGEFTGSGFDVVLERRTIASPAESTSQPVTNAVPGLGPVTVQTPPPAQVLAAVLRMTSDNLDVPVDWGGGGYLDLLLVLHVATSKPDSIILLDEPGVNLHPSRQSVLSRKLIALAKSFRNQMVLITHSPYFVDRGHPELVLRLDRREGRTESHRLPRLNPRQRARVLKDIYRDPKICDTLFSDGVVLVEGDAEEAGLPVWLDMLAKKSNKTISNLMFVSVHGDGHFGAYVDILDHWGIQWRIVADNKAKPRVKGFGPNAHTYPEDDYSDLMKNHCKNQLSKALVEINNDPKDPAVARAVAQDARVPPPVLAIWAFLRPLAK